MPNHPTTNRTGPWRLLILDRDPADPKLILATVEEPDDVTPAWPAPGPHATGEAITWVRRRLVTSHVTLTPLARPEVWRVDENPPG
jgi:hypothetical protein